MSFTLTNDYPAYVTLTSVSVGGNTITPTGGVYSVSGISADTTVTVSSTGTPPTSGAAATYPVVFNVTDSSGNPVGSPTLVVTDSGNYAYTCDATTKIYTLPAGTFNVSVSGGSSYSTVTGAFTVTADMSGSTANTLGVTLYPGGTDCSMTLKTGSDGYYADVYNGDVLVRTTKNTVQDSSRYYITALTLPAGRYTYKATGTANASAWSGAPMGSGPLDVSSGRTVVLRFVNFANNLDAFTGMNYTMTVTSADGSVSYSPGSASSTGGNARGWFVLPAAEYGAAYKYAFVPANSSYWGSRGTTNIYNTYAAKDYASLNLSDSGQFVIMPSVTVTVTAPAGSSLRLYHRVKFYEPLEELIAKSTANGTGTVTYTYDAPSRTLLHYELTLDGYVKKAGVIDTFSATSATVSLSDLTSSSSSSSDIEGNAAANIVMNAPDSKYITLSTGQQFELYCFRNKQAINSGTGNYYVDPNYKVEVLYGDSVTVTDPYYAGAVVKAVNGKSGVSIVRVTYGALDFLDDYGNNFLYSKLWERNTALLVFNVNPRRQRDRRHRHHTDRIRNGLLHPIHQRRRPRSDQPVRGVYLRTDGDRWHNCKRRHPRARWQYSRLGRYGLDKHFKKYGRFLYRKAHRRPQLGPRDGFGRLCRLPLRDGKWAGYHDFGYQRQGQPEQ